MHPQSEGSEGGSPERLYHVTVVAGTAGVMAVVSRQHKTSQLHHTLPPTPPPTPTPPKQSLPSAPVNIPR